MKNFSIIVPVYNAQSTLQACLEAIVKTKDFSKECELIVADDGSTDASREIAEKRGAKIISTPSNRGAGFIRNLGAQEASGEYLFFVDSDVILSTRNILDYIKDDFERYKIVGINGLYEPRLHFTNFISVYKLLYMCFGQRVLGQFSPAASSSMMVVKRQIFLDSGGFDESYQGVMSEDIELSIRLSLKQGQEWLFDARIKGQHRKRFNLLGVLKTNCLRIKGIARLTQKKGYQKAYLRSCTSHTGGRPLFMAFTILFLLLSFLWANFLWLVLMFGFLFVLTQRKFFVYLKRQQGTPFAFLGILFSFFEMAVAVACAVFWKIFYNFKKQ